MTRSLAWIVLVASPLACSSSTGGSSPAGTVTGGLGHDASTPQDAPDGVDSPGDDAAAMDAGADVYSASSCVSDAGAPSPSDFANAPACIPGSCVIAWSVDGTSGTKTYPLGKAFSFSNGLVFDADFGTGGHIFLNLVGAVPPGQVQPTAGTLTTPSEGPLADSSLCLADGTRIQFFTEGGTQIRFLGRCVTESCTTEVARPLGGSLIGCCAQ
jgi:hypothetical protein